MKNVHATDLLHTDTHMLHKLQLIFFNLWRQTEHCSQWLLTRRQILNDAGACSMEDDVTAIIYVVQVATGIKTTVAMDILQLQVLKL